VSCAEARQDLGGYVLGALEPEERDAFAAHLAQCPECAAEHRRLAGLPALIAHADGLEIPAAPPAIEERLLDRIAAERGAGRRMRRPRRRRLPAWSRVAAVALAGAALGAAVTAFVLRDDPPPRDASYALVLSGDDGASARAQLSPGRGGTELHLWVKGLPPGGDVVYEVRCERPGWSASAGTFRADARGRAYVVLTTAARLGEYERIRVVRRPDTADVLTGELQ
jgi:putative zinc finger protein